MKTFLIIISILIFALIILLFTLRASSTTEKAPGLVKGQLSKCSSRPNCVCSMYPDDFEHYIEPINIPANNTIDTLAVLKTVILEMGGNIQVETDNYLAVTFTSTIFKFVDDLEITIDLTRKLIHIRSASRVGYSDMGVNKKRVEQLKQLFNQKTYATSR